MVCWGDRRWVERDLVGDTPARGPGSVDEVTAERVAKNDAIFRDANERLRQAAAEHGFDEQRAPFICECADPRCTRVLQVDVAVYQRVRVNPRWFLNVPGHEAAARGHATVVERHDGFVIVEKIGRAGDVAEELAGGSKVEGGL